MDRSENILEILIKNSYKLNYLSSHFKDKYICEELWKVFSIFAKIFYVIVIKLYDTGIIMNV